MYFLDLIYIKNKFLSKKLQDSEVQLSLIKLSVYLMIAHFPLALTASEMGLRPSILALTIVSSVAFIVGFAKSSRENEYKKLMDSFIERNEKSDWSLIYSY